VADPFASARKVMEPAKVLTARRSARQKPVEKMTEGWVKYERASEAQRSARGP
jgi:hypothetical protein